MAEEKLVLKAGVVLPYLSNFQMSADGENFIFTDLDLSNKGIEQLNKFIEEAKEVYNVNMAGNNLADPTFLKELQNIIRLDLARNKIKNVAAFCTDEYFKNLKWLDLQNNKIVEMPNLVCPQLEYLDISYNKLEKINEGWLGHNNLRIVKSIENKFKSLQVFKNMSKLEELYVANNLISSLMGLEGTGSLKKLHLRHNKVTKVEEEGLPDLPNLEYLNLRTNTMADWNDFVNLVKAYPSCKDINILNCPLELEFSSMNLLIADVLALKPSMVRFCKIEITDKHKLEAVYYSQYKWTKAEEVRKAKEEEERKKAEAEGEG
jgi:hypothetical protein